MSYKHAKATCKVLFFLLVVISALFIINGFKITEWHHVNFISSKTERSSSLDLLEEAKLLPRITYEQPQALKPPRTDVLTMTTWFAPIVWDGTYNIDVLNAQFQQRGVRIGLATFAIKKYVVFLQQFIETAEKFFMVGYNVNYYVITDRVEEVHQYNFTLGKGRHLTILKSPTYKRWQDICFSRMEIIRNYTRELFTNEVDYLAVADIDMKFSDDVGVESLGDLFGTIHPGYYETQRQHFTYERRPASKAYIPKDEGDFYYAAGYFGGTTEEIFKLTNYCTNGIMADKEKNIEAVWHEESHLNRYFLYYKPTKLLSPEYVWNRPIEESRLIRRYRFICLPKNYQEIRY
uniref:Uncharacterized protein n=1 Tax=Leptobrachium leishanense TaxID=445787 RepID=A0A8C5WLI5_9ANUR